MLFYQNLDQIVFHRNELFTCDELVVISGYVGPTPIRELEKLPIKSTVIYGMYGCDGIQQGLHNAITSTKNELTKVDVLYSTIPVHSKCYVWKNRGKIVHALIGSANFSENGLRTPFKEVLAETTVDTFDPLDHYITKIFGYTISCDKADVKQNKKKKVEEEQGDYDKDVCSMPLYIVDKHTKEIYVPDKSGINWGMARLSGSHVQIDDAYIGIGTRNIERYPALFPPKQKCPTNVDEIPRLEHRHNDSIEIIWDDGATMTGLLEGNVPKEIDGKRSMYPKQISTTPNKSALGKYIRERMGIKSGVPITYQDLLAYGRTTIDVSLQGEGIYYFDFSVEKDDAKIESESTVFKAVAEKTKSMIIK